MPASLGHFTLYGFHLSMPAAKAALMLSMADVPHDYMQVDRPYRDSNVDWKTLSRWGEVPTLIHDKRVLVQSNTILRYLAKVTGRFAPQGEAEEEAPGDVHEQGPPGESRTDQAVSPTYQRIPSECTERAAEQD